MTTDPTRSRILEVMARAMGAPVEGPEGEKWGEYPPFKRFAELALTAYESHLSAEGMAVVPVEPTEAMLAALHDKVLIRADPALRECSILNDRETYAAMLSASPYGKASMQEASAERAARSEQIPPGKEESK
jgi:hypothetical protein